MENNIMNEENEPIVSVIIPVYNKAPYLEKCIQSVVLQTYNEYELIVVDDGSTDSSFEVLRKCKSIYSNIIFKIISQTNQGVSVARNIGIGASRGNYIAFLDADDWWEPDFLKKMVEGMCALKEAGLIGCNYWRVKDGRKECFFDIKSNYIDYFKTYRGLAMPLTSISVIVKRDVLENVKEYRGSDSYYFKPWLKMGEDVDLWIRIALNYKIGFINEKLAYYNQDVQTQNRAIGKLYNPSMQFAFNTEYLIPYELNNNDLHDLLNIIKITCLRQYYLSHKYYKIAKAILDKIDIDKYRGEKFADYLWQCRYYAIFKQNLVLLIKRLKNR